MGQRDFTYIGTLFFRSIQRFVIYLVVLMNAVFTTVESVNYQGNIYWYLQKLNTSILFYKKCLKEADQNDDSLRVVVVLSDIGYVFSDQDKNDSAIYYLHKSIELAEEYNFERAENRSKTFLAHSYENTKQYAPTLEIYKGLIGYCIANDSKDNAYTVYTNMASCYQSLGQLDTVLSH